MHSLKLILKFLSAALVLASATSQAATVINFSFETDVAGNGNNIGGSFTGWVTSGAAGYQDLPGTTYTPLPTDGIQNAYANSGIGVLSQTTSETIVAGQTYTLTVDVGLLNVFAGSGSTSTIRLFGLTTGIGTAIVQDAAFAPTPGFYTTRTITYTAPVGGAFDGQTVGIALSSAAGTQVIFDNVRFNVIPEPSAILLGGLGALGLLRRRRI